MTLSSTTIFVCFDKLGDGEGEVESEGDCVYLVTVWRGDVERVLANQAAILKECTVNKEPGALSITTRQKVLRSFVNTPR